METMPGDMQQIQNNTLSPLDPYHSVLVGLLGEGLLRHASSWIIPVILMWLSVRLWNMFHEKNIDPSFQSPLPPGSMGIPFLGETLHWIFGGVNYYTTRRESYGQIYKTHLLGRPTIRVIGAQNVRKILNGEHNLVTSHWPTSTRIILGEGALSLSSGVLHRKRRKVVLKAFSQEALSSYVLPIQKIVQTSLPRWCQRGFLLGYPECRNLTFSIAARVLLGFDFSDVEQMELLHTFEEMQANLFSLPVNLPGSGLRKGVNARNKIIEQLTQCIEQKRQDAKYGVQSVDVLSNLLNIPDEEDQLTELELKEAALELLFAGHETTASAACSILVHLAKNPDVVEKACAELDRYGLMNDSAALEFDTINKLKYINMVVKEILRIMPPIGGGFRRALKTFEIEGYQIPKGWTIAYAIRDTHEMSPAFENAKSFTPERWDEDMDENHRYDYVPFGGGSRACVGKDFAKLLLKVLMIELVRSCSWRLLRQDVPYTFFPVPRPKDNLPVEFTELSASMRRRAYTL